MTADQAQIWGAFSTPIIMLLNLLVSTAIGALVYRFTRKQAQMEALKLVHSRWHDINKIIIEKPQMQRLLGDPYFQEKSDEEIIVYNFLFQILNVTYEVHFAASQGLIDRSFADQYIAGNSSVLRNRSNDVLQILTWSRGYDEEFREKLKDLISKERQR